MERRETAADSHVIIICVMMCGGEQGESAIEIRARKIRKNRFHFSVGLLKMQHPSFVEMVLEKKTRNSKQPSLLKQQFRGHFASKVLVISSGNSIINRRICKRESAAAPGKASCI